jgi:uncharacterized Zn finger protein (UPF0148 family)
MRKVNDMNNDHGAPYATCNHCGWHGKREQLLTRKSGDEACPKCRKYETVWTADASREEHLHFTHESKMEAVQAFINEMQRLTTGMQTVLDVMRKS